MRRRQTVGHVRPIDGAKASFHDGPCLRHALTLIEAIPVEDRLSVKPRPLRTRKIIERRSMKPACGDGVNDCHLWCEFKCAGCIPIETR